LKIKKIITILIICLVGLGVSSSLTDISNSSSYIQYIEGNTPIVISASHGGYLKPLTVADRACLGCNYSADFRTKELAIAVVEHISTITARKPHLIINNLHRSKLDPNRSVYKATQSENIKKYYHQYHDYIEEATTQNNLVLYIDIHGQAHPHNMIELGYNINKTRLTEYNYCGLTNTTFDNLALSNLTAMIIGDQSFGCMLEDDNYPSVPSCLNPYPKEEYFDGGFSVEAHSKRHNVVAIQIEVPKTLRFKKTKRDEFAKHLAENIVEFYQMLNN